MKITYDKSDDAAYIKFDVAQDEDLQYDHIEGEWPININISKNGKVMGIEILNASELMNTKYLEEATQPAKTKVQAYLDGKKDKKTS